jgi:nicotinic acid mononucleotide adenylyltransferase
MSKDDAEVLHEWQRTQAVKQVVHIVYCNVDYEGSTVMSVHATEASAKAEAKRLNDANDFCTFIGYGVEVEEVLA